MKCVFRLNEWKTLEKLLTRFAAPFLNKPADCDGNITDIWDRSHSHLQPLKSALTVPSSEFRSCPLRNTNQALRARTHILLGLTIGERIRPCCIAKDAISNKLRKSMLQDQGTDGQILEYISQFH